MDEVLFHQELDSERVQPWPYATKWLEILNFPTDDAERREGSDVEPNALNEGGFMKFIARQAPFPTTTLQGVTSGIRLLIQPDVKHPKAFFPGAIPFTKRQYETIVREMRLPAEVIDGTSVVGPFFWWGYVEEPGNPDNAHLQIIFRKSDVQVKGTSRGWEMALSYSFQTKITSGYIRGSAASNCKEIVALLVRCARPACHPLLLPFLILSREISSKTEIDQRDLREKLRSLEIAVSNRYDTVPAEGYVDTSTEIGLDSVNRKLADYQCQVMWRRPQAWQNAVRRMTEAVNFFWERTPFASQVPHLEVQHKSILRRLEFTMARLEGLESHIHVTLERLNIQREVMNSIISQRESRLSLAIAAQQRRIATTTGKDSTSMKTLTLMGAMFLPGAFLSSLFGMSFFDFSQDIGRYSVSPRLWVYFATFLPTTVIVLVFWWKIDQRRIAQTETDFSDREMNKLEETIMKAIRDRTGARVTTGISDSRAAAATSPRGSLRSTSVREDGGGPGGTGLVGLFGRISSIWVGRDDRKVADGRGEELADIRTGGVGTLV